MTLVPDASTVVAALVDSGDDGRWAEQILFSDVLVVASTRRSTGASVRLRAVVIHEVGWRDLR